MRRIVVRLGGMPFDPSMRWTTTRSPSAISSECQAAFNFHQRRGDRNGPRPGKLLHRAMQAFHPSQVATHQQELPTVFTSSAGPRMGKRRAPVEAGISQPRRDPAELLLFGDILPGGNHPEQPRHDGTRVRPRCSAITARSAPARTAATSSSSSSRVHRAPARQAEHHRHPRQGSGGHARIMLPCPATPQEASCRDRHRPAACRKKCALTTPIPILLRRDGPVPRHEHRGSTITTRMPGACKRSPRICKVPMWA
jgi:hypothetical protein